MTYSEKLKDPRWQRKRTEILMRDDFKCTSCGDDKSQLHVHHEKYIKGNDPWEYQNDLLKTLCHKCHEKTHGIVKTKEGSLWASFRDKEIKVITKQIDDLMIELKQVNDNHNSCIPYLVQIEKLAQDRLKIYKKLYGTQR